MKEFLSRRLPFLFFLFLLSGLVSFLINAVWGLWQSYPVLYLIPVGFLGLSLIGHAIHHLGVRRSIFFLLVSGVIALVAEHLAIVYQPFGAYEFHLKSVWSIGSLPISVLLAWCFFIYIGYSVSNAGLTIWGKRKPHRSGSSVWTLMILVLTDAWLITSMDLMIDPVQKFEKNWTWLDGGAFFGVPPGNFLGWMAVVGTASLSFRLLEYFRPTEPSDDEKHAWIPVLIYLMIALFYLYAAHKYFGWPLAVIGIVTMLPLPIYILGKRISR